MRAASSAQSLLGAPAPELNALASMKNSQVEFPISGDATTLSAPFYASIARANAAPTKLQRIIAETHAAKEEAGRAQRERAAHTP